MKLKKIAAINPVMIIGAVFFILKCPLPSNIVFKMAFLIN